MPSLKKLHHKPTIHRHFLPTPHCYQVKFSRMKRLLLLVLVPAALAQAGADDPAQTRGLVRIDVIQPPLLPEVRYATRQNFTGEAVYPTPQLWLHRDTARALARVQRDLRKRGLALKIYDAYRPLGVQRKMWNLIRDERYVSNPDKNLGRHTRGTAVDVTLVDRLGRELPMPSDFDDFSPRANRAYRGGTDEQRRNRQILEDAMRRRGFIPYPDEWWHFDLDGWERYPALDIAPSSSSCNQCGSLAPPAPASAPK